jgi:thiol-disulfide isomerase/thioredoxin
LRAATLLTLTPQDEDSPNLVPPVADEAGAAGAVDLTSETHAVMEKRYPLLLVNFYAPWCPWSQRLSPVWEATARLLHEKYPPNSDGRLLLGKVDCTVEVDLCREAQIQGFPSVRVFRGGSDLVSNPAALGRSSKEHAAYVGDRTVEALVAFAEGLLPVHTQQGQLALPSGSAAATAAGALTRSVHPGCAIDGFVYVKKVPGALYVSAQSPAHSFVVGAMNASHMVHELSLGAHIAPRKLAELERLMPGGLPAQWADKLAGTSFTSEYENTTHEHYLQIVRTLVHPLHNKAGGAIDAYEYTAHSHSFEVEGDVLPHAKFSFAPSPMLVNIQACARCAMACSVPHSGLLPHHSQEETKYGSYHFITTVSALIGGVFTVASIADAGANTVAKMVKKNNIGKLY